MTIQCAHDLFICDHGSDTYPKTTLSCPYLCWWVDIWVLFLRSMRWHHNESDGVSNHQAHGCLLNRLFGHRTKKTSKLRVTCLCEGNSQVTGDSPHKGPVARKIFPFDDVIMWRPPSTMWALIFLSATMRDVWIIPPFQSCFMCCMLNTFYVSSWIAASISESSFLLSQ